jgi:cardiolipin synthase
VPPSSSPTEPPAQDRRATAIFGRGRVRRLFGLDRSAPPPRQTQKGEPLNPWTIPNFVGYLRIAGIPVFLWLALESGDGRTVASATLFWLIAAGDYLDGLLARVTGQYSRLGTLMDPFIDRLTILAGAIVCWDFELLPRWALALLAAREVVMLGLAQYGLRRGVDIRVNWPGRISVFPIMGGIFFALVFDGWVTEALLIVGLALAILATVLYARTGIEEVRRSRDLQGKPQSP